MFLESLLHASIWNTRQPSLLRLNARAGRSPGDERSVESAASLRPSLRPNPVRRRSPPRPSQTPSSHGAGSLSLLQARPKRIGTPPLRTAQRLSPGVLPAAPMRNG